MFDALDRQILVKNDVVFRSGDVGHNAYLIEQGKIEILLELAGGERQIAIIEKGELFGEVAMIDQQPRTATARAMEDTILIPISRQLVSNLLNKSDPVLRHLMTVILERFRKNQGLEAEYRVSATKMDSSQTQRQNVVKVAATKRLSLAQGITRALSRNEFALYYQPICSLINGHIAGFEALIRWNHPTDGLLPPMDFLMVAEQTGQILEMGLWTLERACHDWPILRECTSVENPFVSVNLSASQLLDGGLVDEVSDIIDRNGMPPAELKLELTEGVVVEHPELASTILNRLTELGSTLALDNYGTGYSGLDHLQRYPIATLKLDRAFIAPMLSSDQSFEIVRSSIGLAHSLGMKVVAEGIETDDVRLALLQLGCEYGQGWLFGKPGPLENIA